MNGVAHSAWHRARSWRRTVRPLGVVAAVLVTGCLFESRTASTEILDPPGKAALTGIIYDSAGRPVPGVRVRAFPVDFDPVSDSRKDSVFRGGDATDGTGAFKLLDLDTGSYNVLAMRADGTRLLIRDLHLIRRDTLASDHYHLERPGALTLRVPDSLRHDGAYLYLPGTPIYAYVDTTGEGRPTLLDSVPAGEAPGVAYDAPGLAGQPVVLSEQVVVTPGDTVPADAFAAWARRKRIFINTAGTGGAAPIPVSVFDFPLLVRLDAGNFAFGEARADGGDIRFAKADGKPLSYEIESWDAAGAKASVWVRLDTVRGNDAGQFIRMYWGNADVNLPRLSSGPEVFRASAGYRGVWHLAESGSDSGGHYRDATAGGNHGTGTGFTAASRIAAPAGYGQAFRWQATSINAGTGRSLHADTSLTLESWVRIDAYHPYGNFISKAFDADIRPRYEYGLSLGDSTNNFRFTVTADSTNLDLFSKDTVQLGRWCYVAATYDGKMMRLFIDGALKDTLPLVGRLNDFGRPLLMGRYEHTVDYSLEGGQDEVRMSDVARPAAYFRLGYEAQREDSKLLRFED